MIRLAENRYGKCRVRLMRVKRDRLLHLCQEWTVQVLLTGDFVSCYESGDNTKILATDTMKNIVYSQARDSKAECIEEFAKGLGTFLLHENPQADTVSISIASTPWDRITVHGKPHPSAFERTGGASHSTAVLCSRDKAPCISSGIDNLVIMKTANSGFEGFIRNPLTTLPETSDRLFATALRAEWSYRASDLPFDDLAKKTKEILLQTFAEHDSKSVQHTLYAMGQAVLNTIDSIHDIQLVMPNKHCLLVDLSKFGQTNPNEIFVPTDEPYGYIEGRLSRED
jgi:urate oxidase